MNYIAITLSLINISLLFVFLFKFKSLFITDDIVEKTKQKMNQIISDVNQNAQRDIDLVNHCSRQIRSLIKESEEQMQSFQEATNILRDMLAEIDRQGVNKSIQVTQSNNQKYNYNDSFQNNYSSRTQDYPQNNQINTTKSDVYTRPYQKLNIKLVQNENQQPDLFSDVKEEKENKRGNLTKNVVNLHNQGYSVEQIASELSCSVTEVQLIIDMI